MQNITYKHKVLKSILNIEYCIQHIENNEETEKQLRIFKIHRNYLQGYQLTVMPDLWDQKVWDSFQKVGKKEKSKLYAII